jgi:hypothetical protein
MARLRAGLRPAALAALAVVLRSTARESRAAPTSLEYAVKANYLYKFAPFIGWPPTAFSAPDSPFNLCVLGDPFGAALEDATRGQRIGRHAVAIRRLQTYSPGDDCQVLYIGRGTAQSPAEILLAARGAPVLTVTDAGQGVSGGIVHFVLRDGRVRFAIDARAARASGLAVSSKLLDLAVNSRRVEP